MTKRTSKRYRSELLAKTAKRQKPHITMIEGRLYAMLPMVPKFHKYWPAAQYCDRVNQHGLWRDNAI
jgi:hypothetical protein